MFRAYEHFPLFVDTRRCAAYRPGASSHFFNTAKAGGLPLTITDPNSVLTTLAYNNRNWLTSSILTVSGGSLTSSITYDSAGNLTRATLPDSSYLNYTYDNAHRLTTVTNRISETQNYTLDAMGNTTQDLWKDASAVTKRQHTATFDALGRIKTSVGGMSQSTGFTYDNVGNVLTLTDPLSGVTTMTYDNLNRLLTSTDAATNLTSFTYDALGRLLTVTDPRGKVTSYVYNGFGDVIQETSPDRGTWVWVYDKDSNVTQQTDATGAVTNMTYDALERILTRTYPADSSLNVAFTYDQAGHGKGVGRLTSVVDDAGSLSLDYEERGLITSQLRTTSSGSYTTGFTYESAGRYSSITTPSAGWITAYVRDNAGQVTSMTAKQPSVAPVNLITSATYLPFGPVKGFTQGNGIVAANTYDLDYRNTDIRYTSGGSNIYYTSNTWNANNNLTKIVDNVSATNNQDLTYDVIDRLTFASSGSYTSSALTYDSNSNRLTYGGTTYTYSSTSNRLATAGGSSISYISTGNISAIGTNTMTYNKANQLATATVSGTASAYIYDAFGQRIIATVAAGTPINQQYDQDGTLLSEIQGAAQTNYAYLGTMPIAAINTAAATISYIHTNHLGTPQKATNAAKTVVWSGAYQPFGTVTPTASVTMNLRFPGQQADATGYYHNGFRNYNPALGRYLESDPIGLAGGLNTYVYGANNPYKYTDPDGTILKYIVQAIVYVAPKAKAAGQAGAKYFVRKPQVPAAGAPAVIPQTPTPTRPPTTATEPPPSIKPPEVPSAQQCTALPTNRIPTASEVDAWASGQGLTRTQRGAGPVKYLDKNGVARVTVKQGSSRTPGSESPHMELKNSAGQRVDLYGNPVTRSSPENHTPIEWDW